MSARNHVLSCTSATVAANVVMQRLPCPITSSAPNDSHNALPSETHTVKYEIELEEVRKLKSKIHDLEVENRVLRSLLSTSTLENIDEPSNGYGSP
ncbi:hypothetical protein DFQ28_007335 [Apophysomyces sp. BC1034]|nr:hypothetical protein DFQ28_007335 [Apophysomyces sp. BC1034]